MTTTEKQAPPECCPICGMAEDWRDFDALGNANRVAYMCGAKWAQYNAHREPLSPPEWVSDCNHAMDAALRCGATLHPTAREVATAALVAAALADVATWAKVVELTEEDQELAAQMRPSRPGSDVELTDACRAHDAAAGAYRDAVLAYLATVTA